MSSTVLGMFEQTQMAEAAYADLWNGDTNTMVDESSVEGRLTDNEMSATQAADLLEHWQVVDHIPDLNSGFSATLFRDQNDPGHYTLVGKWGRSH